MKERRNTVTLRGCERFTSRHKHKPLNTPKEFKRNSALPVNTEQSNEKLTQTVSFQQKNTPNRDRYRYLRQLCGLLGNYNYILLLLSYFF